MAYSVRWRCSQASWQRGRWSELLQGSGRKSLIAILILCLQAGLLSPRVVVAASPAERAARQQAIKAIPLDQLNREAQTKIESVVRRPSIYRRMPTTVIQSDPDLYLFLVRHPEAVVNMWELMGVTKVKIQRTADYQFDATDGSGTVCNVELIYGDKNTHVLYAEGTYEGPLLRRLIRGRCVLVLQSDYSSTVDHSVYITSQLDMFLHFENVGAELLARTLHPLVGKTADHNFVESTRFLGQVSDAAEKKKAAMQELARKLTNLEPDVRKKFSDLTASVNRRTMGRRLNRIEPAFGTARSSLDTVLQETQLRESRRNRELGRPRGPR